MIPQVRHDLDIRPSDDGGFIVKDPVLQSYFRLSSQEEFLLRRLNGKLNVKRVLGSFQEAFGEPLTGEELQEFIQLAAQRGLLVSSEKSATPPATSQGRGNWLYLRFDIFDPDGLFNALLPFLQFCWTRSFLVVTLLLNSIALMIVVANWHELFHHVRAHVSWEGALLAGTTLLAITIIHECGHGLTCQQFGGRVREMGLLLMYFMPCLYCNVSDAWLIPEKSKRLLVTLAGGYIELCLWSLAVFVWRIVFPGSWVHSLCISVITVSGFRIVFNFNPFLKLDGYYLLSDYWEIPNLRQQAMEQWWQFVRWLLWGADPEPGSSRSIRLLGYGLACWSFSLLSLIALAKMFGGMAFHFLGGVGIALVVAMVSFAARGLIWPLFKGEVRSMIQTRWQRTIVWIVFLAGGGAALSVIPMTRLAYGTFEVEPLHRFEVRTPVAGFLKQVSVDEGDEVKQTSLVAMIEVPDLDSRITRKQAEIREVDANVQLLQKGTRREEISEQEQRVIRAREWRDLATTNLEKAKKVFQEDILRLDLKVKQLEAEVEQAKSNLQRTINLRKAQAATEQQFEQDAKKVEVARASLDQAIAEKNSRKILANSEAEQDLAKREKDLADEEGALALLQAGSRDEAIAAEEAKLARLQEEFKYLQTLQQQCPIMCDNPGVIVTPRVKEKVGQYLNEGDLICVVEALSDMEIKISMQEQEVRNVEPGQAVQLKARALPFDTFNTTVDRIAPSAKLGENQSIVTVYASLRGHPQLRPGMTGYARVDCGTASVGAVLLDRAIRYVRTEFWW